MLVIRPEDVGREFFGHLLNLSGLSIKARLLVDALAGFQDYSYRRGDVVEVISRLGMDDDYCEYFFVQADGSGRPCKPKALERVPDDTPTTRPHTINARSTINRLTARAVQEADYLQYVKDFKLACHRGENPMWDPPSTH